MNFVCNRCGSKYESSDDYQGDACGACENGVLMSEASRLPETQRPQPSPRYSDMQTEWLTNLARSIGRIGTASVVIGIIVAFFVIVSAFQYESSTSMDHAGLSSTGCATVAGFLVIGFWLHVLATLIHIRRAVEASRKP